MKILVIKVGAAGDVVRTTPLLHILSGEIDWVVSEANSIFLRGAPKINRIITPDEFRESKLSEYDLVINLEDSIEYANIVRKLKFKEIVGVMINSDGELKYSKNSEAWFDMSLISRFGREKADNLKFRNRKSYQELIFHSLGKEFRGEAYFIPATKHSNLFGDVAVAPTAGNRWPMKNWAFYNELIGFMEHEGFVVNVLPKRPTIEEHIADIKNHAFLISGDSLPMHIALGMNLKVMTFFQCTSPHEIYGYNTQIKLISPKLSKYFYKTSFTQDAVTAISLEEAKINFLKLTEIPKAHGWN